MKLYSTKNIIEKTSFRYVVMDSFPLITCKNWQYLKSIIPKDLGNTLFIHIINRSINSHNTKMLFFNDKNEFIDFYMVSGVKHLMIAKLSKSISKQYETLSDTCINHFYKAERIWTDAYISNLLNNQFSDKTYQILPVALPEISSFTGLIKNGMVKQAANVLGYLFQLRGKVVYGNHLGQKLGYPTANLLPDEKRKIIPGHGVYVALINVEDKFYKGMVNIGMRPTLNNENVTIEAHLFDFDRNIYKKNITIHFLNKLRDEKLFSNLELLKKQLAQDKKKTLSLLQKAMKNIYMKDNFCFIN